MKINAEFDQRVIVRPAEMDWTPSPMPGVDRKPLDRIGDEVARATTIVRYAPDSAFSAHTHTGGEEYIVLDGVFQDEHGDFPKGMYVRNPPTSSHTPRSKPGAVIFVKLWQFDMADRRQAHVDLNAVDVIPRAANPAIEDALLFKDAREEVRLERWAPDATASFVAEGGFEMLVLSGRIVADDAVLGAWDWLRVPDGETVALLASQDGARVWTKTGHLRHVSAPAV